VFYREMLALALVNAVGAKFCSELMKRNVRRERQLQCTGITVLVPLKPTWPGAFLSNTATVLASCQFPMQLCKNSAVLMLQQEFILPTHLRIVAVLMIQESYAIAAKTHPRFCAQFIENIAHVDAV
jgi:hypothetical protein